MFKTIIKKINIIMVGCDGNDASFAGGDEPDSGGGCRGGRVGSASRGGGGVRTGDQGGSRARLRQGSLGTALLHRQVESERENENDEGDL